MIRCLICYNTFENEKVKDSATCPACSCRVPGVDTENERTLRLQLEEIQLVLGWAERGLTHYGTPTEIQAFRAISQRMRAIGEPAKLPLFALLGRDGRVIPVTW